MGVIVAHLRDAFTTLYEKHEGQVLSFRWNGTSIVVHSFSVTLTFLQLVLTHQCTWNWLKSKNSGLAIVNENQLTCLFAM